MPVFNRRLIVTIVRSPGTPQEHRQEHVQAGGTVDTNALFYADTDINIKLGDEIHANHLDEPRVITAIHQKTDLSGELTHHEVELVPLSTYKERQIVHHQRSTSGMFLGATSSNEGSKIVQIFLCHANEDKPQVREVYQRLKAEGFLPWLDEEDLLAGQLWRQEIPKVLRSSDFILIFLSQTAIHKIGYVQNEFKLAIDAWKQIPEGMIHTIPVRLDNCEIPEQFREFHWVNLFEERGFERLFRAIRAGVGQRQPSVPAVASQQSKTSSPDTAIKRENLEWRQLALALSTFPQERRDNLTPEQLRFLSHLYFDPYQNVEQMAAHTGYSIEDVKQMATELSPLVAYRGITLFACVIDQNWARNLARKAGRERFPRPSC